MCIYTHAFDFALLHEVSCLSYRGQTGHLMQQGKVSIFHLHEECVTTSSLWKKYVMCYAGMQSTNLFDFFQIKVSLTWLQNDKSASVRQST